MNSNKFNKTTLIIGTILLSIGILVLVMKGISPEFLDAKGMLHENFFLLPIGYTFIFLGIISYITIGIKTLVIKHKR